MKKKERRGEGQESREGKERDERRRTRGGGEERRKEPAKHF